MSTLRRSATTGLLLISSIALFSASLALARITSSSKDSQGNRIRVVDVSGRVDVSTGGLEYDVELDSTIRLPSHIVTGEDGKLDIEQAETSISIAPDSEVTIPEAARDGQLIARLVQHRGNVFYDVAKREIERFRVETPYLVAVIKGTQFNVSVQNETTTISLFEGRLELQSPDGSETVEIVAGDIAIRSLAEPGIRVIGPDEIGPGTGSLGLQERPAGADASTARVSGPDLLLGAETLIGTGADEPASTVGPPGGLELGFDDPVGGEAKISQSIEGSLSLGLGGTEAGLGAELDLGGALVEAGLEAGVDLGAGSLEAGLGTGLDLGGGRIEIEAGIDPGMDPGGSVLGLDGDPAGPALDPALGLGNDLTADGLVPDPQELGDLVNGLP